MFQPLLWNEKADVVRKQELESVRERNQTGVRGKGRFAEDESYTLSGRNFSASVDAVDSSMRG